MIFQLTEEIVFPDPKYADDTGLLAVGGDLSLNRLLLAYSHGIFPWFEQDEEIYWYAPQPRFVLFPENINVHKSMRKWMSKTSCTITENQAFKEVVYQCATISRSHESSTWITERFQTAYWQLHQTGFARSIEVWEDNELVGGLYGVEMNDCFFGESMFHKVSNASKYALIHLCRQYSYRLIDCQTYTPHLESLGAEMIEFERFLEIIQQ